MRPISRSLHACTRRRWLVGSTALGLSLPALLAGQATAGLRGRAKSVVVLYLSGGPSQLDTFDLKPQAPEEIRGTFLPTRTNVPGIQICEHFPRLARLADKYCLVRSFTHDQTDHLKATYWMLTGGRIARPVIQHSTLDRNDRPHLGAVLARELGGRNNVPPFVMAPEFISPVGPSRPGQHAGFLGPQFDPYLIHSDPSEPGYSPGPVIPPADMQGDRFGDRRTLLAELEQRSVAAPRTAATQQLAAFREQAYDVVTSAAARQAFDLSAESERTRDRYGRHTFGQSTLVARRLVEAGVRLVQVNWVRHDNAKGLQGYDSHAAPPNNPPHLAWCQNELFPPTDAACASLLEDLADRGLLDETLVIMLGEFGRTPKFNKNGGRDHWSQCSSVLLAGGGIRGGLVYGASDAIAAYPTDDPLTPDDLFATVYHLTGINRELLLHDLQSRPLRLNEGTPVARLMA